jgi:hypothetical protein
MSWLLRRQSDTSMSVTKGLWTVGIREGDGLNLRSIELEPLRIWRQAHLAIEAQNDIVDLLASHKPRVARDVGRDDGGEAALLSHSGSPALLSAVSMEAR